MRSQCLVSSQFFPAETAVENEKNDASRTGRRHIKNFWRLATPDRDGATNDDTVHCSCCRWDSMTHCNEPEYHNWRPCCCSALLWLPWRNCDNMCAPWVHKTLLSNTREIHTRPMLTHTLRLKILARQHRNCRSHQTSKHRSQQWHKYNIMQHFAANSKP